jgi:hypothetical protein
MFFNIGDGNWNMPVPFVVKYRNFLYIDIESMCRGRYSTYSSDDDVQHIYVSFTYLLLRSVFELWSWTVNESTVNTQQLLAIVLYDVMIYIANNSVILPSGFTVN